MKLHEFFRDRLGRRGIAAVEFAIIVPVLLVMFIGTVEVLTLYRAEAKLNALAMNVAQTVSITESVSLATAANTGTAPTVTSLKDICQGALLGMAPFPATGVTISIASVTLEPSALNSNKPAATPAFDEWEADSAASTNTTCSTPTTGTTILNGTGASAPISIAKANASTSTTFGTGMLEDPCDNVIIVQASYVYPGLTGLIVTSRPTLTQTAYARWSNASTLTQLLCANCQLSPATPLDYCNSTNTTATN